MSRKLSIKRFCRFVRRIVYNGVPDDTTDYRSLPGPKVEIRRESETRFGGYVNGERLFTVFPIRGYGDESIYDLPIYAGTSPQTTIAT